MLGELALTGPIREQFFPKRIIIGKVYLGLGGKEIDSTLGEIHEFEEERQDGSPMSKLNRQQCWQTIKSKVKRLRSDFTTNTRNLDTFQTMRNSPNADNSELDSEDLLRLETAEQKLLALEEKLKPKRWWRFGK